MSRRYWVGFRFGWRALNKCFSHSCRLSVRLVHISVPHAHTE